MYRADIQVEIKCWNDFVPPRNLVRCVRAALKYVDPEHVEGLDHVLLLERVPDVSISRDANLRRTIEDGRLVFGAYRPKSSNKAAHIILIVRSIYDPIPRLLTSTPAMTLRIAEVIAHEVAHHLIAERRFTLRTKPGTAMIETEEEFAHRFARAVTSRMERKLNYRFGSMLLKTAANVNFQRGARAWRKGKYDEAAKYFDLAMKIKVDSTDASYWFFKAREKASEHKSSS